jgi:hypothetical protein
MSAGIHCRLSGSHDPKALAANGWHFETHEMGRNWGSWGQAIPRCALKARQRGSDISGVVLMRAEVDNGDPVIVSTYSLTLNDGFLLNV